MRPRRIRRGSSAHRAVSLPLILLASMRPRRIRRGSHHSQALLSRRRQAGFNEAPANSPGIALSLGDWLDRKARASMRPRRIRRGSMFVRVLVRRVAVLASMRPRRIRRGSQPRSTATARARCSSFNEAPANSPGIAFIEDGLSTRGRWASMRPRRIRRGSLDGGERARHPVEASMRPRRIRRGSREAIESGADLRIVASMRPRRIRRGSLDRLARRAKKESQLQ